MQEKVENMYHQSVLCIVGGRLPFYQQFGKLILTIMLTLLLCQKKLNYHVAIWLLAATWDGANEISWI